MRYATLDMMKLDPPSVRAMTGQGPCGVAQLRPDDARLRGEASPLARHHDLRVGPRDVVETAVTLVGRTASAPEIEPGSRHHAVTYLVRWV